MQLSSLPNGDFRIITRKLKTQKVKDGIITPPITRKEIEETINAALTELGPNFKLSQTAKPEVYPSGTSIQVVFVAIEIKPSPKQPILDVSDVFKPHQY
ncbi:hypothetical protein EPD60_00975 [Flaviaesturariibacter flavus]|uniref:Uncharacterized protein n=1 Tax=Flaviaesturariibacter flavus TaxID=2502780 RepID=A0A4R1BND3_9BACT|nr:hypothetical protein [Flaviaesturariibacter flavus]TCJ19019.1 hypothetical protein EPD60_00975 [Flaviaesturariibacter flavus]